MIKYEKKLVTIDDDFINNNGVSKIIAPVHQGVNIYDEPEVYTNDLKKFSQEQIYVFAINFYTAEVDNGGHHQFFFNSTGIVYEDALNGFKALNAGEYFNILNEATKRLGNNLSKERAIRTFFLERANVNFDDLDKKFYELDKTNPLNKILKEYILKNKDKFYFQGVIEVSDFDPEKFVSDFIKNNNK